MMEELYGLQPITDNYSGHVPMATPENFTFPHHVNYNHNSSSDLVDFSDQNINLPVFGLTDRLISGSSAVSDAASMVAEIQRSSDSLKEEISSSIRVKIASHPLYPKLLEAYIDCQKVGAPPEIACLLDEIQRGNDNICKRTGTVVSSCFGADPELDEFMETYCGMLVKYKSDLSRPFDEATSFISKIEIQLKTLCCTGSTGSYVSDHEAAGSSSEEVSAGEMEMQDQSSSQQTTTNEDHELKERLLRKYSGYISTLKQEFCKKKKKGKLPRDARQILLDWWNIHYKWPYPTEADKVALAELTGLDQKQINNWFINQRKRHWKPSENMQFAVMDTLYGPFCHE